ncbi:MAG: hypothetical protein IJT64_03485 [Kiritimatiellae bacterium]|nr:hypothetical protein [Kiritimatiellia bacterium]
MLKDWKPAFVLTPVEDYFEMTDEEKIDVAARRVLERYRSAFEELAK